MKKNKIILIGTSPIVEFHVKALRKSGLVPIGIASSNKNSSSLEKFADKNKIKKSYFKLYVNSNYFIDNRRISKRI